MPLLNNRPHWFTTSKGYKPFQEEFIQFLQSTKPNKSKQLSVVHRLLHFKDTSKIANAV